MITYELLKELALVFAKITGYRYISFNRVSKEIDINFSEEKMRWIPIIDPIRKLDLEADGLWNGFWDYYSLRYHGEILDIDWSKCLFDCKEADNEEET